MTLVDTGPLVALFDSRDPDHAACHVALREIEGRLCTTVAVLAEVFHMLAPASRSANGVKQLILDGSLSVVPMDEAYLGRCFEYMAQYEDRPMDFADASLVVAAEVLGTLRILTIDFTDFSVYRVSRGHRRSAFNMVGRSHFR